MFFRLNRSRLNLTVGLILAIAVAVLSGWREVGLDRSNYNAMYLGVVASEDWTIKLWYAKDLLFLMIVVCSNYFSEDPRLAFIIVTSLSMLVKYISVRKIGPTHTLHFIILYALLLAPGLEFAAMRSALAIGFVMLAAAYRNRKSSFLIFSAVAVMAHVAISPVVILSIDRINIILKKYRLGYIFVTLIIFLSSNLLMSLLPHGSDYLENSGTLFAYGTPVATLGIAWLLFYRIDHVAESNATSLELQYLVFSRQIVYGLVAIAFGITSTVVLGATRYLEIAWVLMLLTTVLHKKSYVNRLGGLFLIIFLSYNNIIRGTWSAILNSSVS